MAQILSVRFGDYFEASLLWSSIRPTGLLDASGVRVKDPGNKPRVAGRSARRDITLLSKLFGSTNLGGLARLIDAIEIAVGLSARSEV